MKRSIFSLVVLAGLAVGAASAQDVDSSPPLPSKHQMMKECMAKEEASDGGMPKEDMKRSCKDIITTESENAKAERAALAQPAAPRD